MRTRKVLYPLIAVAVAVFAAAPRAVSQPETTRELTVFAAASLTEAFQTLGKQFESTHPSTRIRFNFGGSQQLVQQIVQGAHADLFASANMKQMKVAVAAGMIDTASIKTFARNRLVVVFPRENPVRLRGLHDLSGAHLKIVLADSSVPAGQYALQVLDRCSRTKEFGTPFKAEVVRNVVSYEENVRAVLSKVQLGECDAGIVYSSDIAQDSLGRVGRIDIPDSLNVIAEYPAAIIRGTASQPVAREFLEFVLSPEGGRVLSNFGFIAVRQSGRQ